MGLLVSPIQLLGQGLVVSPCCHESIETSMGPSLTMSLSLVEDQAGTTLAPRPDVHPDGSV